MHKLRIFLLVAMTALLAACGGGGDNTIVGPPGGGSSATVATLSLLTSSPQIPSDGATPVTITALVRDSNNNVTADVPVTFQSSSGALSVSQPAKTDANGALTATLNTAGDPTNRAITVTATAGTNIQGSVTVNVIGTALAITGPSSLPLGSSGSYTVVLTNAAGAGIGNQDITIQSSKANGLSATHLTTDSKGGAAFTLNATNGGTDTVTATALGISATQSVSVSADSFKFTSPAPNTEVTLGSNVVVTVQWQQNGVGVANQAISFSTTRGTLSAGTANTDASGSATVTVAANNAGPAVLTATTPSGTSVQLPIEFVATTPATIDLQADPFTVATNGQSTITAIVRDAAGNLVKNQFVNFVLTDTTGGSLSVAQAKTNSQGRAQTFYNASSTTSRVDGVRIDATVQGTAVTDFVALTVAQRQVFISIGTGNTILSPNDTQYQDPWVIQVTDAQGNGVNQVNVDFSVLSRRYWDGTRVWDGSLWQTRPGAEALPIDGCPDEDLNRNGVLDPGEDLNNNGRIEAGNVATAAAHTTGGNKVTTDSNGFAFVDVFYAKQYAYWLEVTLEVRASVQGTEFSERATFRLPGAADDFNNEKKAPPGLQSPFGTDGLCQTPPPPDGP
ncbi:MAG TPA: Ig-like domain-containing protein [Gammaproteobacteria bacterium]|nr:Ig-like domain-containing protein [Gammaproteobacteria bacterium]